jgi:hypothetical protein
MVIERRPMTRGERGRLRQLSASRYGDAVIGSVLIVSVGAILGRVGLGAFFEATGFVNPRVGSEVGVAFGLIAGVASLVYCVIPRKAAREDLCAGEVEVINVNAIDAIKILNADEGDAFYVQLDEPQKVLFVEGRYSNSSKYCEDSGVLGRTVGPFPNRKMSLIRAPRSEILLSLNCLGEHFPPSKELDGEALNTWMSPGDGAILDSDLQSIAEKLKNPE